MLATNGERYDYNYIIVSETIGVYLWYVVVKQVDRRVQELASLIKIVEYNDEHEIQESICLGGKGCAKGGGSRANSTYANE